MRSWRGQKNLAVPFSSGWSDLGGWDAVLQEMQRDEKGVANRPTRTLLTVRIRYVLRAVNWSCWYEFGR